MKKRIAIYYENRLGRNDGFPLYAYNLLKEYPNVEALHLIPNGDYEKFGNFDLNVWVDWGEDGLKNLLQYEPVWPKGKTVYFASDTHLGYDYRLETAKKANYAFVAQKEGTARMQKDGVPNAELLYHGVEPRAFPDTPIALKKYDVCFVGHIVSQERLDFLDRMFKEFPNFWFGARLSRYVRDEGVADDCADIFRKSKIILNPPTKEDVNMRVFEGMATGSFMLTKRIPGIEDLFVDKKHLVLYNTIEEAIDLAKYYIEHDEEREAIAKAGKEEVLAKHTYKHRLDVMLDKAGLLTSANEHGDSKETGTTGENPAA